MKNIYESTITHRIAAFICGLCLLLVLLITATQAVCYWIPDWWRNEYAKYDTPSNVRGEMSLDDAVHVTEDMLEYCIGRRDTLDDTEAAIDGVTAPFFTDSEKAPELFIAVGYDEQDKMIGLWLIDLSEGLGDADLEFLTSAATVGFYYLDGEIAPVAEAFKYSPAKKQEEV